ncbi:MAG: DciA family protein, partial [Rhodospirillales bacterium]
MAKALVGLLAVGPLLSACSSSDAPTQGRIGYVEGFLGAVVSDEPRASVVGRDILSAGGTAADAVAAMALTLTVTMPGAASLGGGGACVLYLQPKRIRTTLKNFDVGEGKAEAISFLPTQADAPGGLDAAVPALPRGLFTFQARHGRLSWPLIVGPHLAAHTLPEKVFNGVLHLWVDSGALTLELQHLEPQV